MEPRRVGGLALRRGLHVTWLALVFGLACVGALAFTLRTERPSFTALPEHVASPFVDVDKPVGVLLGTVIHSETRLRPLHAPWGGLDAKPFVFLTIRCDDVRWLGQTVVVGVTGPRLERFAEVLDATVNDSTSFVGRQALFVFDVFYLDGRSVILWGLSRCSLAFDTYLHDVSPERIREIDRSAGVLPLPRETHSTGFYR